MKILLGYRFRPGEYEGLTPRGMNFDLISVPWISVELILSQ